MLYDYKNMFQLSRCTCLLSCYIYLYVCLSISIYFYVSVALYIYIYTCDRPFQCRPPAGMVDLGRLGAMVWGLGLTVLEWIASR